MTHGKPHNFTEPRHVVALAEEHYQAGRDGKPHDVPLFAPAHVRHLLATEARLGWKHAHGVDGPPVRYVLRDQFPAKP